MSSVHIRLLCMSWGCLALGAAIVSVGCTQYGPPYDPRYDPRMMGQTRFYRPPSPVYPPPGYAPPAHPGSGLAPTDGSKPPADQPPPPPPIPVPPPQTMVYGAPVPGKPGFVTSPHAPDAGYVDVRGFPPGTEVKDPYSGKIFLVP